MKLLKHKTNDTSMCTWSGIVFDLAAPTKEMVCIADIAHALSLTYRYGGHTPVGYTVAQHSLIVAQRVPLHLRLQALLHDAHEAYIGDLVSPFKHLLKEHWAIQIAQIERSIDRAIFLKFKVPGPWYSKTVKNADKLTYYDEVLSFRPHLRDLCHVDPAYTQKLQIEPLTSKAAEELFLTEFWSLCPHES